MSRVPLAAASGSTGSARRTTSSAAGWPTATPEVCLAVADEQTAGRGREGRRWVAPRGAALLLSLGFRPDLARAGRGLAAGRDRRRWPWPTRPRRWPGWPPGAIRLKWPNDLVVELDPADRRRRHRRDRGGRPQAGRRPRRDRRASARADPRVVVGIGINTDWPAADFPPELAGSMTSLREASDGRPIDRAAAARRVPRPARGPASRRCAAAAFDAAGLGRPPADDRPHGPTSSGPTERRDRPRARRRPGTAARLVVDDPTRPAASATSSSARSSTSALAEPVGGGGVTRWPDRHSGRVDRPEEGASAPRPPRPRPAARRGGPGGPGPVRGPVSEVPGPGVQLRVLRAARPSRGGGRHRADVPRRPGQPRPVRGARPAGRRRGRLDLPGLAVPDRPERRRRAPPPIAPPTRRRRSMPPRRSPRRSTSRPTPRGATRRPRPGAPWTGCPATAGARSILRFVDEMSTAEIAGVLGRSEGAVRVLIHRALRSVARDLDDRRPVTGRWTRPASATGRGRRARHRPLPRVAARGARGPRRPTSRVAGDAPPADIARAADRLSRDLLRAPPLVPVRGGARPAACRRRGPDAPRPRAGAEGTVVPFATATSTR